MARPARAARWTATGLLAWLAAAGAFAGATPQDDALAELTVGGASAGGPTELWGHLASFTAIHPGSPGNVLAELVGIEEDARHPPARLEIEGTIAIDTDIERNPRVAMVGAPQTPDRERIEGFEGRMVTTAIRPGFLFYVSPLAGLPLPEVAVWAAGCDLASTQTAAGEPPRYVDSGRPPLRPASGPSIELGAGSPLRQLTITGSFALTAWEMDFLVQRGEEELQARSGYFYTPTLPSLPDGSATAGTSEYRQIFMAVHDGSVTFTFDQPPSAILAVKPDRGHVDGRLTVQAPAGTLWTPDGQRTPGSGDFVSGDLDLTFGAVTPAGFEIRVGGSAEEASIDGQIVRFAPPGGSGPPAWLLWAGAALLLGAAVAGGVLGRRWRLARTMRLVEATMEEGRYDEVAGLAPSLLRSRRHRADAQVMRTVALLRLGRLEEAVAALDSWRGPADATVDYLWAYLHALRGEQGPARERIEACLHKDASMESDVHSNPVFAPLLGHASSASSGSTHREGYS